LHNQLGFLKVKDIDHLELSKLMHKFHNNTLPQSYNSLFKKFRNSLQTKIAFSLELALLWIKEIWHIKEQWHGPAYRRSYNFFL